MSIATLKKKSQVQYRNLSVGQPHFSINGTHRSQGYIGQTSLSRSLPRTLMNGIYPRGHGGCCGTFPIKPIVQSAVTSVENPNTVKMSVVSTKGMLEEKTKCISNINTPGIEVKLASTSNKGIIVKPDNNRNTNYQGNYITQIAKKEIQLANTCTLPNQVKANGMCPKDKKTCSNTKPESDYIPISQGQYLLQLGNQCVNEDIAFNTTTANTNVKKSPFACG